MLQEHVQNHNLHRSGSLTFIGGHEQIQMKLTHSLTTISLCPDGTLYSRSSRFPLYGVREKVKGTNKQCSGPLKSQKSSHSVLLGQEVQLGLWDLEDLHVG